MTDFNMPPGVSVNDIPGNRPEDIEAEAFIESVYERLFNQKPWIAEQYGQEDSDSLPDWFDDVVDAVAEIARDLAYSKGYSDGSYDRSVEALADRYETPCDACHGGNNGVFCSAHSWHRQ